jgi:predicted short-subunit dehydrogenase-like oxidoreductase (DUF2520 family)
MASCFAHAFAAKQVAFTQVSAREQQWRLAERTAGTRTVLLAVSDRYIAQMCDTLLARGVLLSGDTVVHLAGAQPLSILASAQQQGVWTGVLHPCVAVASRVAPPTLAGLSATFEGPTAALAAMLQFCLRIELNVVPITAVDRAQYHAAAALCATGAVALAQGTVGLLRAAITLEGSQADPLHVGSQLASSLLRSAAANVASVGAQDALASPLMRGDLATLAAHLAAMQQSQTTLNVYRAVLLLVLDTLQAQGTVDKTVIVAARKLLATER